MRSTSDQIKSELAKSSVKIFSKVTIQDVDATANKGEFSNNSQAEFIAGTNVSNILNSITNQISLSNRNYGIELAKKILAFLPDPRLVIVPALNSPVAGNTEIDYSGKGNVVTYYGSVATDKDLTGIVPVLNLGVGNASKYIAVADNNSLSFGNGSVDTPFTVVLWHDFKASVYSTVFAKHANNSNSEYMIDFRVTSNKLYFSLRDISAGVTISCTTSSGLSEGLQFLTFTYSGVGGATAGDGLKIYRNGVLLPSTAVNNASYVSMENTAYAVSIGSWLAGSNYLAGKLGAVALTGGELSQPTIENIYNATKSYYGL